MSEERTPFPRPEGEAKPTPGPWHIYGRTHGLQIAIVGPSNSREDSIANIWGQSGEAMANARLIAAAPELLVALEEGRRAIGDHFAPGDCYATGPLTGDTIRDLVECPACSFIAKYDAALAKVRGGAA